MKHDVKYLFEAVSDWTLILLKIQPVSARLPYKQNYYLGHRFLGTPSSQYCTLVH